MLGRAFRRGGILNANFWHTYCTAPGVALSSSSQADRGSGGVALSSSSQANRGRGSRRLRRGRRGSSGGGSGGGGFCGGCSGRYNSPLVVRERQGVEGFERAALDINAKGAFLSVGAG